MKKKWAILLMGIGILFILWAILGRYVVLPGYNESLANGNSASGSIPTDVSPWKIARYLIWAFSYKLGVYFFLLGGLLQTAITKKRFAFIASLGLIYLALAYMPLAAPGWVFGVLGVVMTGFIGGIIWQVTQQRDRKRSSQAINVDLQLGGYFFFAMATYTLCGLLGVRTSALDPERMIAYGLQADALSFALHALIELTLGWGLILLSLRKTTAPKSA
ncbi:MAG: hypothetical protein ACK5MW_02465 [Enterococcus sp.]